MAKESCDYVVIGGGSGGCVVAGRLAQAGAAVTVLEAGGSDRRPDVVIPAGVISVYKNANWRYTPEPDPSRNGAVQSWPAGRILGGGGSINGTVFVRGNPADFDSWADSGAKGWEYDSVLPYFKRMERWNGERSPLRGTSGPIAVAENGMHHPANALFHQAALNAGYRDNPDYNGETQDGVGPVQVNQDHGRRSSASRTYLRGLPGAAAIDVRLRRVATQILFDGKRAIGVEYRHGKQLRRIFARQEVILSAGAIASPRLLMLSGIGPAEQLGRHGISARLKLPGVGANLQEHPAVMQRWLTDLPTINTMGIGGGLSALAEYARHGTGALAATVFQTQVMHRTREGLAAPDIQIAFANFATTRDVDKNGAMKVKPSREAGFLVAALFLHPRARGTVGLRSASPEDRPVIEHSMLGIDDDVRDVMAGMAEARRIMNEAPIADQVTGMFEPERQCRTDADWLEFTRENVTYGVHPLGTCRMGVDEFAVVDPELRVHDAENLRVVDASVIPSSPSGNTNASTMMIGEKASDLILGKSAV